ncbi:MAG: hypothetical protein U0R21_00465 [Nocardioidaceae bacterium]
MKTALAAALLALGLFASGCTTSSTGAKSEPTPSDSTQSPTASSPSPSEGESAADADAFGPTGFDGITLGMSLDDVKATDAATFPDGEGEGGACVWFTFVNAPGEESDSVTPDPSMTSYDGLIGPKGVELLAAREGMKTPEGIELGSTKAEALAAYPNAKFRSDYGNYRAHVEGQPSDAAYFFTIRGGKVRNLNISLDTPQCFN